MNQALARILPLAVALPVVALAACSSSGGSDEPSDSLPSSPGPVAIGWQAPRPDPQAPRSDPQAPGGSGTGSGTDPGAGGPGLNCSSLCDRVPQRCVPDCQDSCGELAADEFEAIGCGGEARAVFLCVYSAGLTCDDEGNTDVPDGACEEPARALIECVRAASPPEPPPDQGNSGSSAQAGQSDPGTSAQQGQ